jgi:hypothetical protein
LIDDAEHFHGASLVIGQQTGDPEGPGGRRARVTRHKDACEAAPARVDVTPRQGVMRDAISAPAFVNGVQMHGRHP